MQRSEEELLLLLEDRRARGQRENFKQTGKAGGGAGPFQWIKKTSGGRWAARSFFRSYLACRGPMRGRETGQKTVTSLPGRSRS